MGGVVGNGLKQLVAPDLGEERDKVVIAEIASEECGVFADGWKFLDLCDQLPADHVISGGDRPPGGHEFSAGLDADRPHREELCQEILVKAAFEEVIDGICRLPVRI